MHISAINDTNRNCKYDNINFKGSVGDTVYKFADFAKKAEAKSFFRQHKNLPTDVFQAFLNKIEEDWKIVINLLEENAKKLHKDTKIEVVKTESIQLPEFCLWHKIQNYKLHAHNTKLSDDLYLTDLCYADKYFKGVITTSDFRSADLDVECKAKQFLNDIKKINFNRIDKRLYKQAKKTSLSSQAHITDGTVKAISEFGQEALGKQTDRRFARQVAVHNEIFTDTNNTNVEKNKNALSIFLNSDSVLGANKQ